MAEPTDAPTVGSAYRILLETIDSLVGEIGRLEEQLAEAKARWNFFNAPPQFWSIKETDFKPFDNDDSIDHGRYAITVAPYTPTIPAPPTMTATVTPEATRTPEPSVTPITPTNTPTDVPPTLPRRWMRRSARCAGCGHD